MQKKCDEFKPQVVLHHPHSTDCSSTWKWSDVSTFIPFLRFYSSGIHYQYIKNGVDCAQRNPLDEVLNSTKLGNVENTIIY